MESLLLVNIRHPPNRYNNVVADVLLALTLAMCTFKNSKQIFMS